MYTLLTAADHTDVIVTSAKDIVVAVLTTITAITVAALGIGWPLRHKAKKERAESRRQQSEIHEQVANTHSTNLRDDMDGLAERMDRQSGDIGEMRKDIAELLRAVRTLERRFTKHVDGRDTTA